VSAFLHHGRLALEIVAECSDQHGRCGFLSGIHGHERWVIIGAGGPDLVYCEGHWRLSDITHWSLGRNFDWSANNLERLSRCAAELFRFSLQTEDPRLEAMAVGYVAHVVVDQFTHPLLPKDELSYNELLALQDVVQMNTEIPRAYDGLVLDEAVTGFLCHAYLLDAPLSYILLDDETRGDIERAALRHHINRSDIITSYLPRAAPFIQASLETERETAMDALKKKKWTMDQAMAYVRSQPVRSVDELAKSAAVDMLESIRRQKDGLG